MAVMYLVYGYYSKSPQTHKNLFADLLWYWNQA